LCRESGDGSLTLFTSKVLEKYPKLCSRNDKSWLVWFEDGELKTQLFSDKIDQIKSNDRSRFWC